MGGVWKKIKEVVRGKKVTDTWEVFDVTALEIIDSDVLNETRKRLVLKYEQTNYGSRNYVLDYGNTGAAQFFQYYLGGKYKYTDNLPKVSVGAVGVPIARVIPILESMVGASVTIISTTRDTISKTNWIRSELCRRYNYNRNTNTLISGSNTYSWTNNTVPSDFNIPVTYISGSGTRVSTVPVSGFTTTATYYLVDYSVPSKGLRRTFAYCPFPGVSRPVNYADLNIDEDEGIARYIADDFAIYPVAMLRNGFWNINAYNKPSPGSGGRGRPATITQKRYDDTVDLLGDIGIDVDIILDEISKNNQISKLKDIFFLVGISPANHAPIVSKLLYRMFSAIGEFFAVANYTYWSRYCALFEETLVNGKYVFNTYLEWTPRQLTTSSGTIGRVGSCTHQIVERNYLYDAATDLETVRCRFTVTFRIGLNDLIVRYYVVPSEFYPSMPTYGEGVDGEVRNSNDVRGLMYNVLTSYSFPNGAYRFTNAQLVAFSDWYVSSWNDWYYNRIPDYVTYTKILQVVKVPVNKYNTDGKMYSLIIKNQRAENVIDTLTIDDLFSQTYVTVGGESVVNQFLKKDGKENKDFLIPLPVSIVQSLSLMEKTDLLSHSLQLAFYISTTQSVTRYEGGFLQDLFKWVGVIITIIIAIVAPGAGAAMGGLFSGGLGAAVGTALSTVFSSMLIGMALSVALKIIIKVAGNSTLGRVLSAFVMVAAIYVGGGFNSPFDSVGSTIKFANQLAEIPMQMVNMYVGEKLEGIQQRFGELQEDVDRFNKLYTERYEQYQEVLSRFDPNNFGVTGGFLTSLQYTPDVDMMSGKAFSPTALYSGMISSMYNFDILYRNDISSSSDKLLTIGMVE